jgi:hypothetical protein
MSRPIGGRAFDFALIHERCLVNNQSTNVIVRDDPLSSAAEDFETILVPGHFGSGNALHLNREFHLKSRRWFVRRQLRFCKETAKVFRDGGFNHCGDKLPTA